MEISVEKQRLIRDEFDEKYWPYYLYLERSLLETTRYVHLSRENFECYSYEFNSLLVIISTEFENVVKFIYHSYDLPKMRRNTKIYEYFRAIKNYIFKPVISNKTPGACIAGMRNIVFKPLEIFSKDTKTNPDTNNWWNSYNGVKHRRTENFLLANMENVLNALSSVYIIDSLFMICNPTQINQKEGNSKVGVDTPLKSSQLFVPHNFHFCAHVDGFIYIPD